jgi:threonine synthase
MNYISTRGADADHPKSFSDILLEGLAPDGGLYLPQSYPVFNDEDLNNLRAQSKYSAARQSRR